jgi:hypothetical protein
MTADITGTTRQILLANLRLLNLDQSSLGASSLSPTPNHPDSGSGDGLLPHLSAAKAAEHVLHELFKRVDPKRCHQVGTPRVHMTMLPG